MAKGRGHAWDTMRYGDTINEWAVRILLECILVYKLSLRRNKAEMCSKSSDLTGLEL